MTDSTCRYVGPSGIPCPEEAPTLSGLCFWHDPATDKRGPDVRSKLEALVRSNRSLEGFALQNADLHGAHLTMRDAGGRVDLSHADLSRANLAGAHLFNANLQGANLMKARLSGANLNNSHLEDANLLGAELEGTRLERVRWGRYLRQERLAHEAHHERRESDAVNLYGEAEEVFRYLRGVSERLGHSNRAGHFYHREKVMRRMQMRPWSQEWAWSKLVDMLCGYGEATDRVITFSLGVILICAVLYALLGVRSGHNLIELQAHIGWSDNLLAFLTCVYYSVITFTTVGYGDIAPEGLSRVVAAVEAFTGAFAISLFVVVFVRKMMR